MRVFGRIVLWTLAVIGAVGLSLTASAIVGLVYLKSAMQPVAALPDSAILRLDLNRSYAEGPAPDKVSSLVQGQSDSFLGLVRTVRHAALDPRVKGIVARLDDTSLGVAQIQDLREAIELCRAHGKFAYAFAESFGELGGGMRAYYLATAFERIWLQPVGTLGITGVNAEAPFFKGTLDKLGVVAEFSRRGQYKSAETQLTQTGLPDSDKMAMTSMTQSLFDQVADGIAQGRGLSQAKVRELIDGAPYMAGEAVLAKLVDTIGYNDEMEDAARAKSGQARFVDLRSYAHAVETDEPSDRPAFALIHAVGTIVSGGSGGGLGGAESAGADDIARALRQARRDRNIRAVILRIDSPGGSEVASETIWHAVERLRASGKPVVVSMGDTAASGGYYIAAGANRIIAEPATLTGSIGVFGGKFVAAGLWPKLGVTWDSVQIGANADMGSMNHRFSDAERARFETMLDDSYRNFLARVGSGRHMTTAQVDALAQGRVWTGQQALDNHLIDQLGGVETAIAAAKVLANIPAPQAVALVPYPAPRSLLATLKARLDGSDRSALLPLGNLMTSLAHVEDVLSFAQSTDSAVQTRAAPIELSR